MSTFIFHTIFSMCKNKKIYIYIKIKKTHIEKQDYCSLSFRFACLPSSRVAETQLSFASTRAVTRSPPTEGSKWATVLEPVSNRLRVSALPCPYRPSLTSHLFPACYSIFCTSSSLVRFISLPFVTFSRHLTFSLPPSPFLFFSLSLSLARVYFASICIGSSA